MATVTVNVPEPVPSGITVEMTVEEAAYVAAILGHANEWETYRYSKVDAEPTGVYFALHSAVADAGGAALCAKFSEGALAWEKWRRGQGA